MKNLKPHKFDLKNKKIGIINTSSTPCIFPRRFKRALGVLLDEGLVVKFPNNFYVNDGYLPGAPLSRANDLMELISSNDVGLILSSTGGLSTIEILSLLNFDKIKQERKIICGSSDFTILLVAVYVKTGLVTFYGPALLPNFGEFGGVNKNTFESLLKNIQINQGFKYEMPVLFSSMDQYWDKGDNSCLTYEKFPRPIVLVQGKAKGIIIAGNLESLVVISGTEYMSFGKNDPLVFFIENTVSDTAELKRDLIRLELCGAFKNIAGFVYGLPAKRKDRGAMTLEKVLIDFFQKYKIPVVFGFPFGHINPNLTIPIGCEVEVDAANGNVDVTVIDSTVE